MLQFVKNRSIMQWRVLCVALFLVAMLLGFYLTAHGIGGETAPLVTLFVCCTMLSLLLWLQGKDRPTSSGIMVFNLRPQPVSEKQALAKFKHCQEHPDEYHASIKECGCRHAAINAYPCPPYTVVDIPCEQHRLAQPVAA